MRILKAFVYFLLLGTVDFTNIECFVLDKKFGYFEYCHLKAVNRSYKYMSARIRTYSDEPVSNFSVGVSTFKRLNGFKPFLYNFTVDACRFMRIRKNPLANYFYRFFENYTDMNHRCPFLNTVGVDKLPISHINHMVTKILPIPEGQYMILSHWMTYNVPRVAMKVYIRIN